MACPRVPPLIKYKVATLGQYDGIVAFMGCRIDDATNTAAKLSNLWPHRVTVVIGDLGIKTFNCAQYAYAALAYPNDNADRRGMIESLTACSTDKECRVDVPSEVSSTHKHDAMFASITEKFKDEDLAEYLCHTRSKFLLNIDDSYWGFKPSPGVDTTLNILGLELMILRSRLLKDRHGIDEAPPCDVKDISTSLNILSKNAKTIFEDATHIFSYIESQYADVESSPALSISSHSSPDAGGDPLYSDSSISSRDPSGAPEASSPASSVDEVSPIAWIGAPQKYSRGVLAFYGHQNPRVDQICKAPFLGNFHPCTVSIQIDGKEETFQNSEAAYQALKFERAKTYGMPTPGSSCKDQLNAANAQSGEEIIQRLRSSTGHEAWCWGTVATPAGSYHGKRTLDMMWEVLQIKYSGGELRRLLDGTKGCFLLEYNEKSTRQERWATGPQGGHNWLGLLLMRLRDNEYHNVVELFKNPGTESDKPQVEWSSYVKDAIEAVQRSLGVQQLAS